LGGAVLCPADSESPFPKKTQKTHGMSKAGKNTGLYQKNSFFCEKTALMFFLFFSPFSRGRCAEPVRAFWVIFCVFNGKFRQYFRNFHYFFYRFRNY
jgi:hypothetical protein